MMLHARCSANEQSTGEPSVLPDRVPGGRGFTPVAYTEPPSGDFIRLTLSCTSVLLAEQRGEARLE